MRALGKRLGAVLPLGAGLLLGMIGSAAAQTVRRVKSRLKSATMDGKRVPVAVDVSVNFRIF
jgi:hypothetical protein